ncbi:unnamed protein product [Medioppia subpectinata]|uniref:Uncharacterized protein n=1 Tax=Medioppia subpectinata TaxID=1979941 RepID=A0A7R9M113_9ACAR|nr:unnamed protein product [Medioppia subpectinata]CAG2122840.1 unnamed protein product [Medioppia subpectinata]
MNPSLRGSDHCITQRIRSIPKPSIFFSFEAVMWTPWMRSDTQLCICALRGGIQI